MESESAARALGKRARSRISELALEGAGLPRRLPPIVRSPLDPRSSYHPGRAEASRAAGKPLRKPSRGEWAQQRSCGKHGMRSSPRRKVDLLLGRALRVYAGREIVGSDAMGSREGLVIDADGHICEPPAVWEKYAEPRYRNDVLQIRVQGRPFGELFHEGRPVAARSGLANPAKACIPGAR